MQYSPAFHPEGRVVFYVITDYMPYKRLSTAKMAKAVGCHPNTVRVYEQWGFLPPIPRSPTGYRLYTESHLQQMRLARTALNGGWPGRLIRRSALRLVKHAATGDLGGALELGYQHLAIVQSEIAQAHTAADLLERWAKGTPVEAEGKVLTTSQTALLLHITIDTLRHWERNNLLCPPRNPDNGYRQYRTVEISRLRVIRMLRQAGYSTMAVLRMLTALDQGTAGNLRQILDSPRPDEDVFYATDRWLTTLKEQEVRARQIIELLEERIQTGI
jgi:DNA-binding transcriptional MerR regulator